MRKIILTCEIPDDDFSELGFQKYIRDNLGDTVVNWKTLPNTKELYQNDAIFKKLVKNHKATRRVLDEYINENN